MGRGDGKLQYQTPYIRFQSKVIGIRGANNIVQLLTIVDDGFNGTCSIGIPPRASPSGGGRKLDGFEMTMGSIMASALRED